MCVCGCGPLSLTTGPDFIKSLSRNLPFTVLREFRNLVNESVSYNSLFRRHRVFLEYRVEKSNRYKIWVQMAFITYN